MKALVLALCLTAGTASADLWRGFTAFAERPRTPVPTALRLDGIPAWLPGDDGFPCEAAILAAEARHDLPKGLLMSIGLTEAGHRGRIWPWTVNAEGRSRYFETKTEAVAFVRAAEARGQERIDTGCLQINRYWHRDAFPDLTAAFDPGANADYAARYLLQLFGETGDWRQAVGMYHSREPVRMAGYVHRVASAQSRAEALAARMRDGDAMTGPVEGDDDGFDDPEPVGLLPPISAALDTIDVTRIAGTPPAPQPEPAPPEPADQGLWAAALNTRPGPSLFAAAPARPLVTGRPAPLY